MKEPGKITVSEKFMFNFSPGSVTSKMFSCTENSYSRGLSSSVISPNSKYMAYVRKYKNKFGIAVNGKETKKRYDYIISKIVFDSPGSFHFLAYKANHQKGGFYLVEVKNDSEI